MAKRIWGMPREGYFNNPKMQGPPQRVKGGLVYPDGTITIEDMDGGSILSNPDNDGDLDFWYFPRNPDGSLGAPTVYIETPINNGGGPPGPNDSIA